MDRPTRPPTDTRTVEARSRAMGWLAGRLAWEHALDRHRRGPARRHGARIARHAA